MRISDWGSDGCSSDLGAKPDGCLEIAGHAHRQPIEPVFAGKLGEQRKERRWLYFRRGDGHQPHHRQDGRVRLRQKRGQVFHRAAALLRFVADIDLDEKVRTPAGLFHRDGERRHQRRPLDRMDGGEKNGRASCGAGEGKYGLISGGGGTLKKKKEKCIQCTNRKKTTTKSRM